MWKKGDPIVHDVWTHFPGANPVKWITKRLTGVDLEIKPFLIQGLSWLAQDGECDRFDGSGYY